jgi:hypothetical protein
MKSLGAVKLTLAVFGGGALIYALLWMLAEWTSLSAQRTLPLFIPLSLLWIAVCIGWFIWGKAKVEKPRSRKKVS